MPYKRFKKTLYEKKGGRWTKTKTYPSANRARTAMTRLRASESDGRKSRR